MIHSTKKGNSMKLHFLFFTLAFTIPFFADNPACESSRTVNVNFNLANAQDAPSNNKTPVTNSASDQKIKRKKVYVVKEIIQEQSTSKTIVNACIHGAITLGISYLTGSFGSPFTSNNSIKSGTTMVTGQQLKKLVEAGTVMTPENALKVLQKVRGK